MLKHGLGTRLEVVEYVLKTSPTAASRKYGVALTSVRDWVLLYKHHGINGLISKNERYSGQFKVDVIEYMETNHLSISKTSAMFCIPSRKCISKWKRIYYEKGKDALLKKNRSAALMTNKNDTNPAASEDSDLITENKKLKTEIYHLKMENDYLKKLNDMIQGTGEEVKKKEKRIEKNIR